MFGHSYEDDLRELVHAVQNGFPFALARFHDGELAVCESRRYLAAANEWDSTQRAWLRDPLIESLKFKAPGYHVGVSPPCCCAKGTTYYASRVRAPSTFATIFQNANYSRAHQMLCDIPHVRVGARPGDGNMVDFVGVPENAVEHEWDIDSAIERLLHATVPVFLAAGPASCVIAQRLWDRMRTVPIVDIGSLFDRSTRDFQIPTSELYRHECAWGGGRPSSGLEPEPSSHVPFNPRERVARLRRKR